MDWELFDFAIEVLKAVVLLLITIFLLWAGREQNRKQPGWQRIVGGFALLTCGAWLDISDEFAGLSQFVLIGDTAIESFLEKVICFTGGSLLLLSGLLRWIPTLNQLTARLQQQVEERTGEFLKSKNFIESVLQQSHDLIIACDNHGQITLSNNQAADSHFAFPTGLTAAEWADLYPCYCADGITPLATQQLPLYRALQGEVIDHQEIVIKHHQITRTLHVSASPILNAQGEQLGAMLSAHDISAQKQLQEELRYQATHDNLTGLANRTLFNDRLTEGALRIKRNNTQLAMLMLNLDKFKKVNDRLGHSRGDQLLAQVARRLHEVLRDNDTVARLGGDEFAILLELEQEEQEQTEYETLRIARRILEQLSQPFSFGEQQILISASIGIVYYPRNGDDIQLLMHHAEAAMFQAKASGGNGLYCYHPQLINQASGIVAPDTEKRPA